MRRCGVEPDSPLYSRKQQIRRGIHMHGTRGQFCRFRGVTCQVRQTPLADLRTTAVSKTTSLVFFVFSRVVDLGSFLDAPTLAFTPVPPCVILTSCSTADAF